MDRRTYENSRSLFRTIERMSRGWYDGLCKHRKRAATYREISNARDALIAMAGNFDFYSTWLRGWPRENVYTWSTRVSSYPYGSDTLLPIRSGHHPIGVTPYLVMIRKHIVEHGVAVASRC